MTTPLGAAALLVASLAAALGAAASGSGRPIVIAHRGASGERPEHTLEAYRLAIEQGADFVEPDLVATRDGILVARHENEISQTTDVADRPEFAARRTTKSIDGRAVSGWFTEDLTLAELKTLRVRERLPEPRGTRFDGCCAIPTLEEVLDLVAGANARREHGGRPVGLYPETKHPSHFAQLGLSLEQPLVEALHRRGLESPDDPVFIQSFEVGSLMTLHRLTRLPLVQLLAEGGQPADFARRGDSRTYASLSTPEGLAEVATYARGIGVPKSLVRPAAADGGLAPATRLVEDAHHAGLLVHVYTFRAENAFLPAALRAGHSPNAIGDIGKETALFLESGVDGVFTDHPALSVAARDAWWSVHSP